MKKFKYFKISKTKKLRYIDNYCQDKLYTIFLPGFMSDIEGKKPKGYGIDVNKFNDVINKKANKNLKKWNFINYSDIDENE